jgi:phenylpropionate dioxygenase-like ring-hydroxylating dioxygenase large terminal subunit
LQPRYAADTNFFHCSYELVLENVLDLTHIDFVHGNFAGSAESEDDRITFESNSETVTMIRSIKKKPTSQYHRDVLGITVKYQDHSVFCHVHLRSGMCFLHSSHTVSPSMPLMQTNTPESRNLTRANVVFGTQQCGNAVYRRHWPTTGPMVAAQDEAMLRPQNPRYLFQDGRADLSSRFDAAGIHYRARHNALVERQKAGDTAYLPDYFAGPDIAELFRLKRINQ